jgi:hypothetical protein
MLPHVDPLILLAQRVEREAEALGIKTAIIGGMAPAYHGYVRATLDVDLGTYTHFDLKLRPLADRLRKQGLHVVLNEHDEQDPLDGVLQVRENADSEKVEIVNIRAAALGRAMRDVEELSATNADADMDEIRRVCSELGFASELQEILSES